MFDLLLIIIISRMGWDIKIKYSFSHTLLQFTHMLNSVFTNINVSEVVLCSLKYITE